ncbi:TPA: hypothetical protein HA246_00180 [Candidatus Woesearchaeota archaeon]|nr:hypothetical protein [Candidatus Woesearchaeota archaeon]
MRRARPFSYSSTNKARNAFPVSALVSTRRGGATNKVTQPVPTAAAAS